MDVKEQMSEQQQNDEKNVEKNKTLKNIDKIDCKHDRSENSSFLLEDQHEGTVVCSKCGVVIIDQVISEEMEWRTFGDDNQKEKWSNCRVGGAHLSYLSSRANLNTTIQASSDRNAFASTILRMVKRKSVDNGILHGLKQLDEMADRINLAKSHLEYAQYLYFKMYKKSNYKGIALFVDAKVSACLYIACYHAKSPRTINEICAATEVDRPSICRAIHRISKILKLKTGSINSCDLLPRFCGWLSLPRQIEMEAVQIVNNMRSIGREQRFKVETITATAIFKAIQQTKLPNCKRSHNEIATVVGTTVDAISNCYNYYRNVENA